MVTSNSEDIQIFARHETFYAIAYRHYLLIARLVRQREGRDVITRDDVDFQCALSAAIQREAIVAVIFSALALEAFINDYGLMHFSKSYFKDHLDRLSTVSKWVVFPKLVVGKQLDTNLQPFESLVKLFKCRDKLVHYKTKRKRVCDLADKDWSEYWFGEEEASEALETITQVVTALKELDPSVDIDWLEDAKTNPYA